MNGDTVAAVRMFAALTRGEEGTGDRIANADGFAFRVGFYDDDAAALLQSLSDSESELSLLTGLPPSSLQRMAQQVEAGMRAQARG